MDGDYNEHKHKYVGPGGIARELGQIAPNHSVELWAPI